MAPSLSPRTVLGMTLYGDGAHLAEAVASIVRQTCGDFALLMLDDGSPDPRVDQLARAYAQRDRKSTRLNSSHVKRSRMPSSA